MTRPYWTAVALGISTLALSLPFTPACSSTPQRSALAPLSPIQPPGMDQSAPADLPGLHNIVAFHDNYLSGSVPESDQGFESLRAMGVRTIISVDGAEPDVARARLHGIRYIHLPIGYNGFDEARKLQLARATRDALADGPVYIHCHHGKHRSAGAAAAAAVTLGWSTPDQAVERMKVSGTAPSYTGLYQCAADAVAVSATTLDAVPADFPEVSKPATFVKGMVEMEHAYHHLRAIEKAGWKVPANHPDLVPAAESGRLADLFRNALATDYARSKPADFTQMLKEDHQRAQQLEDWLVAGDVPPAQLTHQLNLIGASCKACHTTYRDKAAW